MKARLACVCLFAGGVFATARAQLTINLIYDPGIDANALAGFQAAAAEWSAVISDPITINLQIGFSNLGGSILGSTGSAQGTIDYASYLAALSADRTSANDYTAVASLPSGPSFSVMLNHTLQNSDSATPYASTSSGIVMSLANARALGLWAAADGNVDGSITFNSTFSFDFNPLDGITAGQYDFVGIAAHEIGHALGFFSGIDFLDTNAGVDEANTYQTPLDMYRYSTLTGSTIDGTAGGSGQYFSIDGGITNLAYFSTGVMLGDGRQASHWKDNLGIGIMDPTAAPGELLSISALDLTAFDVIGYDLAPIPEPAGGAILLAAVAGVWAIRRRRKADLSIE